MESSKLYDELQHQQQLANTNTNSASLDLAATHQSTTASGGLHLYNPTLTSMNNDEYEHYMNEILPMSAQQQLITTNNHLYMHAPDDEYEIRNNSFLQINTVVVDLMNQNNVNQIFSGKAAPSSSSLSSAARASIDYMLDTTTVITSSSSNSDLATHDNFITNYFSPSSHHPIHHHHHHSSYRESTSSNKTLSACKDKGISRTKRVCSSSHQTHDHAAALPKKKRAAPAPTQFLCPLPKVVKEKIGDRIAALHRLVAPFGKTDAASVLTEAFGYIHFLHHQIQTLSMPCINSSQTNRLPCYQQVSSKQQKGKDKECWDAIAITKQGADLKSRGLSVVPISLAAYVSSSYTTNWVSSNMKLPLH